MTESQAALDDREFMDALLNLVIPAGSSGDPPSAGALGLSPGLAAALRADGLLGPLVQAGVEAIRTAALAQHPEGLPGMTAEEGTMLVATEISAQPFLIVGLMQYVIPAYYQRPQVLMGIGDAPRPPFPEGFEVESTDPVLLEKLEVRRKTR